MGRRKVSEHETTDKTVKTYKKIPARTPEQRENQLIDLAYDVVEQRLRDGTATSQETTHFLRLGTAKAKLELKELEEDIRLKAAKTEAIESAKKIEGLYAEAMNAMRKYSGQDKVDEQ